MADPDYICDYCSRSFTRKYNLQTHIENCHLNQSCHCEICDISFGSPTGLFLHLNRGHNMFNQGFPQCDLCGRVFARRQNIINHMINVHLQTNSVFPCSFCDKTFTSERNMKRHSNLLHNPDKASLTCDYCNKIFKIREALIFHMQIHERALKGPIKCKLCDRSYTSNKNLKRHMKMSHREKGIFKCEICCKEYTSNQSLRRHTKSVHLSDNNEQYTCEHCYKVITGKENLESHIALYHKNLDTVGSSKYDYVCEFCNTLYKKERLLRQHIKTTHTFQEFYEYCKKSLMKSAEKLEKSKKMKQKDVLYSCEYCIQTFLTVYDLKCHMRSTHDKDYSLSNCTVCFEKFFSKETIKEHKKNCVPPNKVNSCSHCDKLFTEVSSLDFHTKIFHPQAQIADSNITSTLEEANETCHKCVHCERIYYNERSLKHHLKLKHTTDDPAKCKICEKICSNKYYLASHMKTVHNNTYSSKCDYCDKEFKTKRNIRRHIEYTHLGMQRYKCVECETLFKEKRSLRKHVRVKHPNSTAFPQCHICHKLFESAKSCKTHLKLLHSFNMNTHPCHLCSVSFDSLEALNIHLSTNHLAEDEIYKCQQCNLVFQGHEQFGKHFETFHSNVPSIKKSLPRCIICMKDFSTLKTLKRHIKKFHFDFNVDELATYGSRRRVFNVDCGECIKNFNDDFYFAIYMKLKHLRDSVIFKCEFCKSSYNSLEYAIQRYKQSFDVSQTKLYLSELCTTQMSDDSKADSIEATEPESTTDDVKLEPESTADDVKLEPAEISDESIASDVKCGDYDIDLFDEFTSRYSHKMEPESQYGSALK